MDEEERKREQADDELINGAFQKLLDDYQASRHRKKVDLITKAFNFARQAHKGVRRLSGEPYIMHPIAVAQIACSEIGLGSTSICSALLHDVVEDTDYTVEDIENIFGPKIAQIVDGLTKISGGIFGEQASAQAENFKKLLLTMSDDIRVILIKIADRLHNMRTLDSQPANKKYKIAGETLYIYAPLAHRLGLYKIKSELENLSFRFEHPEEYASIEQKLSSTQASRHELFGLFTAPIEEALNQMGIKYHIKERIKTPYSVWNKMQNKHVSFDEIYDILQGRWIEVQIRSDRMDEIAEQGLAAHWKYKEKAPGDDSIDDDDEYTEDEAELNEWLRTIKEILDDPQPDAMDFLDAIKLNLFATEIFVFTPKGEIKTMPSGCTALDFAFSIHTFIGSHCIGAKVNHKLVPLSHKLQSGDQVEILTSKSQHVQPAWINFVSTAKAKAKILTILRRDNREVQKKGEETLTEWLTKHEKEYSIAVADQLAAFHEYRRRDDFFQALGEKTVLLGERDLDELNGKRKPANGGGWRRYVPFVKSKPQEAEPETELFVVPEKFNRKKPIYITEENIKQYKFPSCCHPIPGDDALGYIDNKNQIEIHSRTCPVAAKLKSGFGNRILDAKWDMHKRLFFFATIRISGIDRVGLLNEVTQIISAQMSVNIHTLNITCEDGMFEGTLELRVHDREDIRLIIENLKRVEDLKEISEIM